MLAFPSLRGAQQRVPCFINSPAYRVPGAKSANRGARCPRKLQMSAGVGSMRIGHGFDLHRLEPGLPLILGGVELEHDRGCAGHSDGDAIYHCVVDAILGALSLPDIGQLFPDTDPRFKDCASHVFMTAAYDKMREKGYNVGNLDVTIILERPKMSPHKAAIRQNIADLLHTDLENVNVKAKTHEKVDAVGENRAVSVHAVTMLFGGSSEEMPPKERVMAESLTGAAVTKNLLNVVQKRVAGIQELTTHRGEACAVQKLYDTVISREGTDPSSSWTAKLLSKGTNTVAKKVGEEAVEVVMDAVRGDTVGTIRESADLIYHLCVLWADAGIEPDDVWAELESREGKSGIAEKASRVS